MAAQEADDRRQQDQCGKHDDEDRRRCRDRKAVEEGHAEDEEAKQRDDHGAAGEQHCSPCRAYRYADRLLGVLAGEGVLAEAVEDEQRVVDADTKADHRCQLWGERRHVEEACDDQDEELSDDQTHDRDDDRQAGGDETAEEDDENDDGGEDANSLA